MPKYIAVLPFVHKPYRDEFMKTCKLDVLEVDNTKENIGIMKSHNIGIDALEASGADWLVVISAAIRFGKPGGLDFIEQLDKHADHHVIEAEGVYGWHLIAFHRRILDKVGRWDENLSPYGFDDIDLSLRIQKALKIEGKYPLWDKVPVDVTDAGMGHSVKLAGVEAPADPRIEYFQRKWGRHPGEFDKPSYDHPFNDSSKPLSYFP